MSPKVAPGEPVTPPRPAGPPGPDTPIQFLKGAGPGRARLLAFGRDHCDVEPAESAAIIDRTLAAALDHRPASSDDAMWAAMRRELAAAAATLTPGH